MLNSQMPAYALQNLQSKYYMQSDGTKVVMQENRTNTPDQTWYFTADGFIQPSVDPKKCLTLKRADDQKHDALLEKCLPCGVTKRGIQSQCFPYQWTKSPTQATICHRKSGFCLEHGGPGSIGPYARAFPNTDSAPYKKWGFEGVCDYETCGEAMRKRVQVNKINMMDNIKDLSPKCNFCPSRSYHRTKGFSRDGKTFVATDPQFLNLRN